LIGTVAAIGAFATRTGRHQSVQVDVMDAKRINWACSPPSYDIFHFLEGRVDTRDLDTFVLGCIISISGCLIIRLSMFNEDAYL
jgi:hypothetical protein